jgi:hypothetical protein
MNCEKLTSWLNEGNQPDTSPLPNELLLHLNRCPDCQKKLKLQTVAIKRLVESSCLKVSKQREIFQTLEKRIAAATPPQIGILSRFLSLLASYPFSLAGALAVFLIMFTTLLINLPEKNTVQISGSGTISVGSKAIVLSRQIVSIPESATISITEGKIKIHRDKSEQLEITGKVKLVLSPDKIEMTEGQGVFSFKPSAKGYNIALRHVVLTVLGTQLDLRIAKDHDRVEVLRGKISWRQQNGKSGILETGNGIFAFAERVEEIKSEPRPEVRPLQAEEPGTIETSREPDLPEY